MTSEEREPDRTCAHCGELNPAAFPVCWNCREELPATARDPAAHAAPQGRDAARHGPEVALAPSPARSKRLTLEVAVVLLLLWLPALAVGLWYRFHGIPTSTRVMLLWSGLQDGGAVALLVYLSWLDGGWRRRLGLERPRPWKELLTAAAAFLLGLLGFALGARLSGAFVGAGGSPERLYEESARDFLPLVFLLGALREELLFRAYLWDRLTELSGRPLSALLLSAALFSACHGYALGGSLATFLVGLALGLLFLARRSRWGLVLGHWCFNLYVTFHWPGR